MFTAHHRDFTTDPDKKLQLYSIGHDKIKLFLITTCLSMIFSAFFRAKSFRTYILAGCFLVCSGVQSVLAQETEKQPSHLKLTEQLQTVPVERSQENVIPAATETAMPAAGNDIIGEGDQLMITVFGQPDLSADVTVGNSGVITLPLVGTVDVRGKTGNDVALMFAAKLEQGQYLLNPKVSVRISQQVSRSFSVLGEVMRPGRFPLQGQISLFDALSMAGGATPRADKTLKLLRRTGSDAASPAVEYATIRLDFDNQKSAGQFMQKVQPNDVLIVGQKTRHVSDRR